MQINDQFNPNLAHILQPSKDNALTILGKGITDYMSMRDNQELKEINMESIREKIKSGKKADVRADKKLDANINNLEFGQEMESAKFDWDKSNDLFNRDMTQKEFNLNENLTNSKIDNLKFGQEMDEKEFGLNEKRTNANINHNNKSLGLQQQRIDIAKNKANNTNPNTFVPKPIYQEKKKETVPNAKTITIYNKNGEAKTMETMTQAELDALLADGWSTTPPSGQAQQKTPETEEPTGLQEWEKKLPSFKPISAAGYNNEYMKRRETLGSLASTIMDEDLSGKALDFLDSGASIRDIDKGIKILIREERNRVNSAKENRKVTLDQGKAKQKYAALAGQFQGSLDSLDYLVENYNDDFVGLGDTMMHKASRVFDLGDTEMGKYRKRFGTILPNFKELENMGASFTASEQQMLKEIMPEIDSGDSHYEHELVNFIEILRDKIKGKIDALEEGDYATADLKNVVHRYNDIIEKGKKKFGLGTVDSTENNTTPTQLRSLTTQQQVPTVTPTQPRTLSREEKRRLLRGE